MRTHTALATAFCALLLTLGSAETAQATDLTGCWEGSWYSCTTGHKGKLKATFTKIDCGYYVTFRGTFWKIFPFRYSTTLEVVGEDPDGTVHLAGSSYLGRIMGTFCYEGEADCRCFTARYKSCKDRGTFKMSRACHSRCR